LIGNELLYFHALKYPGEILAEKGCG